MANPPTFEAEISSTQQGTSSSYLDEDHNGVIVSPGSALTRQGEEENPPSWNEMLFGNLFSIKPQPKRRIVKAIPPPLVSPTIPLPPPIDENSKNDDASDDTEIDPVQWQKEERRRSAQERQRKLHAQMLQERRFSSKDKSPPAEKVANPMSRFLSAFSIHAHPEHKRRAGPPEDDDAEDAALLLSPKRPRPMEEEDTDDAVTESPTEPKERSPNHPVRYRGAIFALALGIVVTGVVFLLQRPRRNGRPQLEL